MLAAMMASSQIVLEILPNLHLTGMLVMVYTLTLRSRALIPIYLYVLILGIRWGFGFSWLPYLYVWTVLWGVTMLLPKGLSPKAQCILYPIVCALHGLFFGILYAPAQALLFGLDVRGVLLWIIAGLKWDLIHAVGNFCAGQLIVPLTRLMRKLLEKQ